MEQKIGYVVLGSTGMLGQYAAKYLSLENNVVVINRSHCDVRDFSLVQHTLDAAWNTLQKIPRVYILNCVGIIRQRKEVSNEDMYRVNSECPLVIAEWCSRHPGWQLIHVSTDCVFSGNQTIPYVETDLCDGDDIYAKSKRLGELLLCSCAPPTSFAIVRTSIVGEETHNKLSLLEWCKANARRSIPGYTNVLWNGVTCLQLITFLEHTCKTGRMWSGCIRHYFSSVAVSKYELLTMISDAFGLHCDVRPVAAEHGNFKVLGTSLLVPDGETPSLQDQLNELVNFGKKKESTTTGLEPVRVKHN